jgi:hypothetical protein
MINNGGYGSDVAKSTYDNATSPFKVAEGSSFPMPPFPQNSMPSSRLPESVPAYAAGPENSPITPASAVSNTHRDVSGTTEISIPEESSEIEVEWVNKVDNVVDRTTGDPFNKSYQLALLKNEYVKKIYGKEIGQNEKK